jgi:hypothetical protein
MTWLGVRNCQVDHKVIFYDHGIGEAPLIPGAGGIFGVRPGSLENNSEAWEWARAIHQSR